MLFNGLLLSAIFWVIFLIGVRAAITPPESCGDTSEEAIIRAAAGASAWMSRNQGDDGRYVYLYYPDTDEVPDEYNEVRHAGVTMALYQAAGRLQDRDAQQAADRAMVWMQDNLEERHNWAALAPDGRRAKLGASALMLVSLAERRLAFRDPQYDDQMRDLATFITEMQRQDGGFHVAWDFRADAPDTYGTSRYYPGEALWALALTHEAFPDEGWDEPARRALEFITTMRDEIEDVDFPPLADQWTGYGLGEMAEWGLTDQQTEYARRLAGRFGLLVRTESQREGSWYGNVVRGEKARASGVGTWAEGMAGLWRLSMVDDRLTDLREPLRERLSCVAGILAERQTSVTESEAFPRPELASGAWFQRGETRMDDQQHAFSALLYALDAMQDNPVREPSLPFPRPLQ
jgi:hypothetical protein